MPPLTTVGSIPPATSSSATIVVVVVLPWVPATAMLDFSRISSASISARRTTGRPCGAPRPVRDCRVLIAVEITTTSAPSRFSARWPSKIVRAQPRQTVGDLGASSGPSPAPYSRGSAAPRRCRTCRCRRCRRNGSGRHRREVWLPRSFCAFPGLACLGPGGLGQRLDHIGQGLCGVGACRRTAPPAPYPRPLADCPARSIICSARACDVQSAFGDQDRRPRLDQPARIGGLVVGGRRGIGDQDRRAARSRVMSATLEAPARLMTSCASLIRRGTS